ncbi:MAG: sulfite exporter TauE/SafE family protein [Gammaproteobacteria bacterium]
MHTAPEFLLIGAVALVGVLHTIVPDHWGPIALLARQEQWSQHKVITTALGAGIGHVLSTLLIGLVMWYAGLEVAHHYGALVARISSLGLILFGGWMCVAAWREMRAKAHSAPGTLVSGDHLPGRTRATALVLVLGSSPMIEGLPAFFAAGRYGSWLIGVMALVFAASTIVTYVVMCVYSTRGLRQFRFRVIERYGEVLSGGFIMLLGFVFLVWPLI